VDLFGICSCSCHLWWIFVYIYIFFFLANSTRKTRRQRKIDEISTAKTRRFSTRSLSDVHLITFEHELVANAVAVGRVAAAVAVVVAALLGRIPLQLARKRDNNMLPLPIERETECRSPWSEQQE